ncbi:MAG: 3-oxoacyl-ACP reductase FabG [Candidatus Tectomicrobia bacterium]|uniref:3-oxoacyl-ACP reductase FabG n=1 Tax=Tectimicrobiota bacterium TaxID=2528274 RepID=A0A932FZI6_UNCTE|nr:3-oxoacyl-ACP reductase FabG [Candidatus Tectomicrobia bacterium]
MGLEGRVAIVTGAGRGIGKATALVLSGEGAAVAVVEIIPENAEATAREIRQRGGKAEAIVADVSRFEVAQQVIKRVLEVYGRLDILVYTVGWDDPKPFVETTPELWEKVLDINLRSTMNCTKAALEPMMANKWGRIVNIASDAGRMGGIYAAAYSAAKAGVIAFGKTIAREMAAYNILVNAIAPGPIETPLLQQISGAGDAGASMMRKTLRMVPLKRLGQPEEIAHAVAFFASEEASYVTGQVLSVNGGMIME